MLNLNKVHVDLTKKDDINLTKMGDFAEIKLTNFHVKMLWKTPIDMDLHVFYIKKGSTVKKGFMKIFNLDNTQETGHIYYSNKGEENKSPFIRLDKDAGVGNTAGDNEENVKFTNINEHAHILVAVNIYASPGSRFSEFDCKVILTADGRDFIIPLNSNERGSWAIIAHVDNSGPISKLINRSDIRTCKPSITNFI